MKKPLLTFLVLFALAFAVFTWVNIKKIDTHNAIAKSPVFVLATPDGITKKTKKSRVTYQVNYSYIVDGATFKIDTEWFDTPEEAEKMAASPVQVAFATGKPDDSVFKTEFDTRDPKEGIVSAVLGAGAIGFVMALIGTLVLLWKFPSLRR
ncbi:hypothetical protein HF313_00270 [Massilia atriviolacea]|uniref:DUF3592 domain-containing protein n=1 Tax=Massilia atriviolacea TaxID=2495579 RepID=A0A430HKW2_9BURK|nr:hypothetical protein [Massilia atriviolacea]RSZ58176.1 hypothetical protein EJB06_14500 [Massilia atriviolacea]